MQTLDKPQIIFALSERIASFNNYVASLNKDQFEATPNGKWSAGQNLDHLIRAIRPLQLAYTLPKFVLNILFGKTNRPSRTYDELVTKYKTKLAAGGKASGPFIPPAIRFEKKDELIRKYEGHKQKLIVKIKKQSETDLDKYILPHPLLGKVTLREMLYFTVHHNDHHLELLKQRLSFFKYDFDIMSMKDCLFRYVQIILEFEKTLKEAYSLKDHPYVSQSLFPRTGVVKSGSDDFTYRFHGSGCSLQYKNFDVHYDYNIVQKDYITISLWNFMQFVNGYFANEKLGPSEKDTQNALEQFRLDSIINKSDPPFASLQISFSWFDTYAPSKN